MISGAITLNKLFIINYSRIQLPHCISMHASSRKLSPLLPSFALQRQRLAKKMNWKNGSSTFLASDLKRALLLLLSAAFCSSVLALFACLLAYGKKK